jgi:hypothetical protein
MNVKYFRQLCDHDRMCDFVFFIDMTQHRIELNINLQGANRLAWNFLSPLLVENEIMHFSDSRYCVALSLHPHIYLTCKCGISDCSKSHSNCSWSSNFIPSFLKICVDGKSRRSS